jgi:predicted nucleic acid-binding protein
VIVLDASAVVEWLLRLPRADAVEARMASPDATSMHVPHLLAVEVAQVVRRFVTAGGLSATRGEEALADLADLDAYRHPHEPLLPIMWEVRANLTAYDAVYVALARALDAPLVTLDRRLADAPGHGALVDLVG